jgi:hypothetical protein
VKKAYFRGNDARGKEDAVVEKGTKCLISIIDNKDVTLTHSFLHARKGGVKWVLDSSF